MAWKMHNGLLFLAEVVGHFFFKLNALTSSVTIAAFEHYPWNRRGGSPHQHLHSFWWGLERGLR